MTTRIEEIEQLAKLIDHHDILYWRRGTPEIWDDEYDKLVESLKALDPNHQLVTKINSPVVTAIQGKLKHTTPMLSLDKVYNNVDLFKWIEKYARNEGEQYSLEPKFDGLSADFEDGYLSSRGDGIWGENFSSKIPLVIVESKDYNGPLKDCPHNKRGEIVILQDTYEFYKATILKGDGTCYKTSRGMCSGILNSDTIDPALTAVLTFIEFDKFEIAHTAASLRVLSWSKILVDVKTWKYPTDGFVIKLKDKDYSHSLGYTSHHPRGQMAYKGSNPSATSKLLNVIWQSGKGRLTPVGVISPVIIAGATITRVSLSNAKNIIDKDININDELLVERAGEIIPYVVKATPGVNRLPIQINVCPDCSKAVVYIDPNVVCLNVHCPGKISKILTDSVARLGFEYLAGATIDKLIDIGITNLIDILKLTMIDISQLDGFAEKSTLKLYEEVQRIKTQQLEDWKLLSALNIKGIGQRVSRKILADITFAELKESTVDQLVLIDTIGIERAIEITEYFDTHIVFINELESLLNVYRNDEVTESKLICFTGKVDKVRGELVKLAESKGFATTNSVSDELAFLVTNNLSSNSNKMKKARTKDTVKIITYEHFYNM